MTEGFADVRCHSSLLRCQGWAGGTRWLPFAEEKPGPGLRASWESQPSPCLWIDVFMVTSLLSEHVNECIGIFELGTMCQAGC